MSENYYCLFVTALRITFTATCRLPKFNAEEKWFGSFSMESHIKIACAEIIKFVAVICDDLKR